MSCEAERQAFESADQRAKDAIAIRDKLRADAEKASVEAANLLQEADDAFTAYRNCIISS